MKNTGFTLLELIIYIGIFSFILAAIFGVIFSVVPGTENIKQKIIHQRDLLYGFTLLSHFSEDNFEDLRVFPDSYHISSQNFETAFESEEFDLIRVTVVDIYGTSTYAFRKYK